MNSIAQNSIEAQANHTALTIIRNMLSGELTPDQSPDLSHLDGYGEIVAQLFDAYRAKGQGKVWDMIGDLVAADPGLASLVLTPNNPTPSLADVRHLFTASEFMERPPMKFLDGDKLIPECGLTMIYGEPGSGKSLWVKRKLAEITESKPVVYVLGEGHAGLPDRLRAEEKARQKPLSSQFLIYDIAVNLRDDSEIAAFIETVRPHEPVLVVFDTLSTCMPGADENAPKDVTKVLQSCYTIQRELNSTVLLVHHSKKDGSGYRGHSSLHGRCDVMLEVKQSKDGLVIAQTFKVKDGPESEKMYYRIVPFETRHDPETGEPIKAAALLPTEKVITVPAERLTGNPRKVLEVLDGYPKGISQTKLKELTGLTANSLSHAAKKLVEQGYITHEEHKPYFITEQGKDLIRQLVQDNIEPSQ